MHEHPVPASVNCEHEFKYCKKCDVVYCEKCKGEWVKKSSSFEDVKKEWEKYEQGMKPKYPSQWHSWPLVSKKEVVFQ